MPDAAVVVGAARDDRRAGEGDIARLNRMSTADPAASPCAATDVVESPSMNASHASSGGNARDPMVVIRPCAIESNPAIALPVELNRGL